MTEQLDDLDMGNWNNELVTYQKRNNLLIVDGLNLAFRWKPRGASIGKPSDYASSMVSTINSLAKSYDARQVIVLSDFKGSVYRKDLHPKYKSDRKKQFANQTPEEEEANKEFFNYYRDEVLPLAEKNFTLVQLEGVEADDVACYFVEAFEGGEDFDHIWMMSTDGDWDELLSERCSRFSYASRKKFTIGKFYDMKGCDSPEQFTNIKAIMGDLGDSVYGVDGIGIKRAYNIVREYGDVFNLVDNLPLEGNQLFIKALNESAEKLMLNIQLVDLRDFHKEAIAVADAGNLDKLAKIVEELKNA